MTPQISKRCRNGCGTYVRRRTLETNPQFECRRCAGDPAFAAQARAAAEARDAARIDWYAVDVATIEGRPMTLNPAESRIAVRHLSPRMLGRNDNSTDIAPWQLTADQVATRIGTSKTNVQKILSLLPAATLHRCPDCRGAMWVIDTTGIVEEHGDGWDRCPMSGRHADQPAQVEVRHQPVLQARLALRLVNA